MDVRVVRLSDRWIMGTARRIEPASAPYEEIWRDDYDPHDAAVSALAVEPGYYGAYFGSEAPGQVDFVAGRIVPEGAEPPEGCLVRLIPGGTYARILCTMGTIGQTWSGIYAQWLPASDYAEAPDRPALEYYPPGAMDADSPVEIYVALAARR